MKSVCILVQSVYDFDPRVRRKAEALVSQSQIRVLNSWEPVVTTVAGGLGLDIMAWQTSIWQVQSVMRPCLIEILPESSASRPEIWVMVRAVADGVLVYQEPDGLSTVPLQRLRQIWSGKLYLTLEESKYRGAILKPGMTGEPVRTLQQTLKDLGYFIGAPSGQFDAPTEQAVKRFQRDNQLVVDGYVGRRTLMMLLHVGTDILASTT